MKRNLVFLLFGLMSLISLSSCVDKIITPDSNEFAPLGYQAKAVNLEDIDEDNPKFLTTTFQVKGVKDLVISEFEKDDWKILSTDQKVYTGNEPLKLGQNRVVINNFNKVIDVPSNYGDIPIAFMNTVVSYDYMGQTVILKPLEEMDVTIVVEEISKEISPIFVQLGYIHITLHIGCVPIATTKVQFIIMEDVTDKKPDWDWDDDDDDDKDKGKEGDQEGDKGAEGGNDTGSEV